MIDDESRINIPKSSSLNAIYLSATIDRSGCTIPITSTQPRLSSYYKAESLVEMVKNLIINSTNKELSDLVRF